ncbi:hypothetical protein [Paludifilum halophilum]|uniref:Uncharacterized protein n=1 Tax=Paludifilum halophilum TaxID=1642702 RepID=A0A235B9P0_9BACL|nr:hypothetical protein [Paludifilum halophilum]OYD09018.1 hypothetical protein CHM34_04385 [Paludifilum halophilum]
MAGKGLSTKEMTQLINNVLGQRVLSEQQLNQILSGATKANERGGMGAVLEYLMKVTQADVGKQELKDFADSVQRNPQMGMDMLQGKKPVQPRGKRRKR